MKIRIFAVGIGGSAGALLRYLVGMVVGSPSFPYGTLFVNILGSFLLGAITGYFMNRKRGAILHLALGTGFCGGFTTMSTFSNEALQLLHHSYTLGMIYIGSTIFFGVLLCMIGMSIFRKRSDAGL